MKAKIEINVPSWQIGEKVSIYFPDTMRKESFCEKNEGIWTEQITQAMAADEPYFDGGKCKIDYICSECQRKSPFDYKYCPNCGVKMDNGKYR